MSPSASARAACCAACVSVIGAIRAPAQDDAIDRLDEHLVFGGWGDTLRVRLSGTLDLEGYYLQQPATGLIYSDGNSLLVPRLSTFLDAQVGPRVYAFAQVRADDGFDPGEGGPRERLDEYALRLTPWDDGRLNLQAGKFATVVGNWAARHDSWDNPLVTAPLPYENLTGVWDTTAVRSASQLLAWGGLLPRPVRGGGYLIDYRDIPVIWGPSYAAGASFFGRLGAFDYALEVKNTPLSSRPGTWSPTDTQWQHPTYSGRLGFRPDKMWSLGFSASAGPYLQAFAGPTLAPGRSLDQYLEIVLGQDVAFAWHHFQLWAEVYEARFEIPGVGNADSEAYYVEAKYKLTPQVFLAARWNEQLFSSFPGGPFGPERWGRNTWRADLGPGYRFTPHVQVKVQYSLEHQDADSANWGQMLAAQFTTRF
jgi:hypothetical protein